MTVDLNPYLKRELVFEDLAWLREHRADVADLFGEDATALPERLEAVLTAEPTLDAVLDAARIRYVAPGNATRVDLNDETVDYHVSFTVFEHIPFKTLSAILEEGKRLLKPDGLFVHYIDFSDHFSQADPSISTINFLQFTDRQWRHYAGNRYAYHNRRRLPDFVDLFERAGLRILSNTARVDQRALRQLKNGFRVDASFDAYSHEEIATSDAWLVACKQS
jgi:SAM-dependent methyltransferase